MNDANHFSESLLGLDLQQRSRFNSRVLIYTTGYSNNYIVPIVNSAPIYQGTAAEEDVRVFSLAITRQGHKRGTSSPSLMQQQQPTPASTVAQQGYKTCEHTSPARAWYRDEHL